MGINYKAIFFFLVVCHSVTFGQDHSSAPIDAPQSFSTGCIEARSSSLPSVELRLLRWNSDARGLISGVFRFKNLEPDQPLVLRGRSQNGRLALSQPYAMVEFLDLNGSWQTYIGVLGHDVGEEPAVITVSPGASIEIERELVAKNALRGVRAQFRLVLPVGYAEERICMASTPFLFDRGRLRTNVRHFDD